MSAFFAIFVRLLIIYLIARFVWTLFAGRKNKIPPEEKKTEARMSRFDAQGKNIEEADFKDLK
jgi:hypothetical protein